MQHIINKALLHTPKLSPLVFPRLSLTLLLLFHFGMAMPNQHLDSILTVLDNVVLQRTAFSQQKEAQIAQLKNSLHATDSFDKQYQINSRLFDLYLPYNTDSALLYASKKLLVARQMSHRDHSHEALMNKASVLCTTGNYNEALEILNRLPNSELPPSLKLNQYHIYRTLYGAMSDFAPAGDYQKQYKQLTALYRDSILSLTDLGSLDYVMVRGDKLIVAGQFQEAIALLTPAYLSIDSMNHNKAILAYMMSDAYLGLDNRDAAKEYLIISATSDLRSVVKEYISLWKLAVLLHHDGNIDRAYNYLKCSLEDAIFSNARLRTITISQIFPIIDKAYQSKSSKQRQQLVVLLLTISVAMLILIFVVVYVTIQRRRLSVVKQQLSDANDQLHLSNDQLRQMNIALSEVSIIKETYIARYMDLCSASIEKLDLYRRRLNKLALTGKTDDLVAAIKSSQFIDDELREFYDNFDDSFLRLFPSFVDDFNALLNPGERVLLKSNERMNTELRIFALIRLGITDSDKIAQFLRYSVTTIYNYRTKARNKAMGVRNDFEKKVMQIGVVKCDQ